MLEATRRVLSEESAARGHRAPLHAEGGGRAARGGRIRLTTGSPPASATSTTRPRRSARSSSARRTRTSMEIRFHGRAAHAGMYPEEGRSAIAAAAKAIADFRLGRVDEETTANVGVINGGTARQHRPGVVHVPRGGPLARRAEARRPRAGDARGGHVRGRARGVRGRDGGDESLPRLPLQAGRPRGAARRAALERRAGCEPTFALSGGAADANVFNERGLAVRQPRERDGEIHTPDEHIAVDDLEGMVDVTLALVDAARMPLSLRRGSVTAIVERLEGLARIEVDGAPCVAYPRLTGPVALGDEVLVNVAGARARARLGRLRRPVREPDARASICRVSRERT